MPGIIAGAADLDPAAVLTATVAGASYGTSLGWVVVLCVPVLFSVFAVSSRIGQETKKGLVELIREHYGRKIAMAIALLIVAVNMAMIVGDIVAVSDSCLDPHHVSTAVFPGDCGIHGLVRADHRQLPEDHQSSGHAHADPDCLRAGGLPRYRFFHRAGQRRAPAAHAGECGIHDGRGGRVWLAAHAGRDCLANQFQARAAGRTGQGPRDGVARGNVCGLPDFTLGDGSGLAHARRRSIQHDHAHGVRSAGLVRLHGDACCLPWALSRPG